MLPLHQGHTFKYQRKARDSNPQVGLHRRLFSRQVPHPAGCLPFVDKLRELESNQRPPGSEPGVTTNSNYPAVFAEPRQRVLIKARNLKHSVRESHPICELQRLASRLRAGESALRESNPPRQLGRLVPLPIGQGHVLCSGRSENRTHKAVMLDRFRSGCHRQLACPSVRLRRQESNLRQGG